MDFYVYCLLFIASYLVLKSVTSLRFLLSSNQGYLDYIKSKMTIDMDERRISIIKKSHAFVTSMSIFLFLVMCLYVDNLYYSILFSFLVLMMIMFFKQTIDIVVYQKNVKSVYWVRLREFLIFIYLIVFISYVLFDLFN